MSQSQKTDPFLMSQSQKTDPFLMSQSQNSIYKIKYQYNFCNLS
jgi:hypothetical protein